MHGRSRRHVAARRGIVESELERIGARGLDAVGDRFVGAQDPIEALVVGAAYVSWAPGP